jgi:hypothetical protein
MKNRFTVAGAATFTLLSSGVFGPAARGDQTALPQANGFAFCSAGPQSQSCVRFQGYIYVGRPSNGEAATNGPAPMANSPALGEDRLYIHVDGADAR